MNWQAPPDNGSAITGYTVSSNPSGILGYSDAGTTNAVVPGLTPGTDYTFTVTATNAAGTGLPSPFPSNSVKPFTFPGAPTNVVVDAGNAQVFVSWSAPASDGFSAINAYTVTSMPLGITASSTGALSTVVTGLSNGTDYMFTVTASNDAGTGVGVTSGSATPRTVPTAPGMAVADAGPHEITVTWTAASSGGSPIISYAVMSNPAGLSTQVGTLSHTFTNVPNGISRTFSVTATNAVGTGPAATTNAVRPAFVAGWPMVTTGAAVLYGVSVRSATDAWAVGDGGLALRWDGGSWTPTTTATSSNLRGVTVIPPSNEVWAAGDNGTVLRWDGANWNGQTGGGATPFLAISGIANNFIWAVGAGGAIYFYNGASLIQQTSGTTSTLRGVWAFSPTDAWAVGDVGTIKRLSGTWSPSDGGVGANLASVWGLNMNDVWAVGLGGTAVHWNGASWTNEPTGTGTVLRGVWGSASNDVYAVGDNGVLRRWDGSMWSPITSGTPNNLLGVSGSGPSDVVVVGSGGIILRGP